MKKVLMFAAGIFVICGFLASCSKSDGNKVTGGEVQGVDSIVGVWQMEWHRAFVNLPLDGDGTVTISDFDELLEMEFNADGSFAEEHYNITADRLQEKSTGTWTYANNVLKITYENYWNYTGYSASYGGTKTYDCRISGDSMMLSGKELKRVA